MFSDSVAKERSPQFVQQRDNNFCQKTFLFSMKKTLSSRVIVNFFTSNSISHDSENIDLTKMKREQTHVDFISRSPLLCTFEKQASQCISNIQRWTEKWFCLEFCAAIERIWPCNAQCIFGEVKASVWWSYFFLPSLTFWVFLLKNLFSPGKKNDLRKIIVTPAN